MKKTTIRRISVLMAVAGAGILLTGCGSKKDENEGVLEDTSAVEETINSDAVAADVAQSADVAADDADLSETEAAEEDAAGEAEDTLSDIEYPTFPLPDYHYYGTEDWADQADYVCQYIIDEVFADTEADLKVCVPIVLKVDDSDKKDVKMWGEYEAYTYQLMNTSLFLRSGGSYGGVAHLDMTGDTPVVTGMDYLEDGSGYDPSVDKLFGTEGLKEAYIDACDNSQMYETQALSDYVNHNGIYITQYQHYGWPPVSIINAPPTRDEDQQIYYVSNLAYTAQYDMRQMCSDETGSADMFSNIDSDEWNDFLIEVYKEEGTDIDAAIQNIRSNLYDESADLNRTDDTSFLGHTGCTSLVSVSPYKEGDHVYVNYIVPRDDGLFVVKISSIYSEDEAKQMATDAIIEAFLGSMELK